MNGRRRRWGGPLELLAREATFVQTTPAAPEFPYLAAFGRSKTGVRYLFK